MPDRHGQAIWPGVLAYQSCSYTCSHGISAGVATLTIARQDAAPSRVGDLVFTDNFGKVVIPRCTLDNIKDNGNGTWNLGILDRRWRWKDLGAVSGWYNQFDPFNKYLPYTVRTPEALATLCLQAMGETRYRIILPSVAVLPPIQWDYALPANSLAALCDALGCRVIYRLDTDSVLIAPLGVGETLPTVGSIRSDSPELDLPERPDGAVVVGQPSRFEVRLLCEAVGDDWDDVVRPIDALEFAPGKGVVQTQVVHLTPSDVAPGGVFTVWIDGLQYQFEATLSTVANVIEGLETAINLNWPRLPIKATNETTYLKIEGKEGVPFDVLTDAVTGLVFLSDPKLEWVMIQSASDGKTNLWSHCPPPTFEAVEATPRMTRPQAREYAMRSVFRYYRIRVVDPSDVTKPLIIPAYGPIVRREQIVLGQSRVEQIVPSFQDERPLDEFEKPPINEFYNGHSRDKPAAIYGVHWMGDVSGTNSDPDFRIREPFTIDAERQLVQFSNYVYRVENGAALPAKIVLEVGVNIRDAVTNSFVCFEARKKFPAPLFGTPFVFFRHDDVQANYIGEYHPVTWKLMKVRNEDKDAKERSSYYLAVHASKYEITGAQNRTFNGIVSIWLDGAIQQVTWSVSPQGTTTQASRNSEHASNIPAYPQRRRAEYLPPFVQGTKFDPNPAVPPGGSLADSPQTPPKPGEK